MTAQDSKPSGSGEREAEAGHRPPPGVTARQRVRVGGDELAFDASAGWMVLRKDDQPAAEMFHVAYLLADADPATRPITFVFNGGPGASSAYLHVGALGPRRVVFEAGGTVPPAPARLADNEETWLRFTDLVFVDPVGTGFSRAVEKGRPQGAETSSAKPEDKPEREFFAMSRDLDALGEFIQRFLAGHHRWTSPVFVAGESYGGFRAGKLSRRLQEGFGVGLCGAILISPAMEWGVLVPTDYEVLHFVDSFPTMAGTAHVHGRGRTHPANAPLERVLADAEAFATRDLASLLVSGERLPEAERHDILARMADFLGVDEAMLRTSGGRIRIERFVRELLRDEARICGLYDATVTTHDPYPDRDTHEAPDPTLYAIMRLFTAGINAQLRTGLGVDTDRDYRLLSFDVNKAWRLDTEQHVMERHVGATDDLRYALSLNQHMRVFVVHGLFDLVTPYFASERLLAHMKLRDAERERITVRHFRGGHMFYTVDDSRAELCREAETFVRSAVPAAE